MSSSLSECSSEASPHCIGSGEEWPKEEFYSNEERTIFVGNMPYKMTWKDLKDHFSQFGRVNYAKCVIDFVTKKRKGFGFVEFECEESAYRAKNAEDSKLNVEGRVLRVSSANEKYSSERRSRNGMADGSTEMTIGKDNQNDFNCEKGTPFDVINDDCLIHIFLFLDPLSRIRVERVNKTWQRCSHCAFLRERQVILKKRFKVFRDYMLYNVVMRCSPNLRSLDVSFVSVRLGNKAMEVIAKCCPGLEYLDISGSTASNKAIEKFTGVCTNLKGLKVVRCTQIAEKGFWYVFHNCQRLESLDCSGNSGITGKCFKYATSHFKELKAANCTQLGNEGIIELSKRCPNLQSLDLSHCLLLNSETISKIVLSRPCLKELNLGELKFGSGNLKIPTRMIKKLANPAQLTRLWIDDSDVNDADVQFVCSACLHLVELDLSCNHLTDSSIVQLSSLSCLQVLSICHLFNITSSSLMGVIEHGKLRILRAQGCKNLDDRFFEALAKACVQLEEVDMAGVTHATDFTLLAFNDVLRTQPHRKLVLYAGRNDFDEDESARAVTCPNLSVVFNFRILYKSHWVWVFHGDERPFNIVMPAWDLDDDQGVPAEMADLEVDYDALNNEGDYNDDGHGFLMNDDPLELEEYEFS